MREYLEKIDETVTKEKEEVHLQLLLQNNEAYTTSAAQSAES